ncbi:MAG: CBS domain-containing protein [Thermoplasmata archaeon]|nr:CBS domain-containing protein [Thermoplasmata archaeon]
MTAKPITIPSDAQLSRALGLMRTKGIHELPVMKKKRLVGLITFETIARRTNLPLTTKVEHLLTLPPVADENTSYSELAEQLLAAGMRAAAVLGKKGELVGLVSRTDLVRALPGLPTIARHRVEEIMSPIVTMVREDEPCGQLFGQIRVLEEHPLPVVDRKGRLTGAVGVSDLGRVLWIPTVGGKKDAKTSGSIFEVQVKSIMHSPALTVEKGTTVGAACALMSQEKVSSVFVLEGGKPTGIVSQTDLLGLAVGVSEPSAGGSRLGDVYVQVHGLRGSGDPAILTEIDRVVAKGLRHISRHVRPTFLSLDITPHATHRSGDATVSVRLHTDHGIFYASRDGWNFYAGIAGLLDELSEQARRVHDASRDRRRRSAKRAPVDDIPVDPDLEAQLRRVVGGND